MRQLSTQIRADIYSGHDQFFRSRLLILDSLEIAKTVDSMEKEANTIREDALKMCWYMRGGLSYQDAMNLSLKESESISKIVKENLETTKKSGLPFF